ncbi:MAG: hypothetical protein HDR11_15750 [Lachnospiraceae bacterium]|nr:hypothetical protein [Lachnospiraceae bacterium]
MKYSIRRILYNLCHSSLLYAMLAVHFALGAGLFIVCMNYRMTSRELLEESRQKSREGLVSVLQQSRYIPEDYGISYDVYLRLSTDKTYTEDLEMLFAMEFNNVIFDLEQDRIVSLWIIFMNENLFDYLYGFSRGEDIVYLGNAAYQGLIAVGESVNAGRNVMFAEKEIYVEGDFLVMGGKKYVYEVIMPLAESTIMPGNEMTGYDMSTAVIFPVEDVYLPVSSYDGMKFALRSILFYKYRNENCREDLVARQLREINAASSTIYFRVNDAYMELKQKMHDFDYDMDRWLLAAVSVLVLSGLGSMGSMFLLLNKRRHLIAVSVACGATMRRMITESIVENCTVLFCGGVLGILTSPLLKRFVIYQGELRLNIAGIGIVFAVAFLFSVISVLASVWEIKVKNVMETLKEAG